MDAGSTGATEAAAVPSVDLLAALAQVPDPRRAGGRRHPVGYVLAVTLMAFTSPAFQHLVGAADWAATASPELLARLGARPDPLTGRIDPPSEATIRRITSRVDPLALEAVFTTWRAATALGPAAAAPGLAAVAIDGKTLRGTGATQAAMSVLLAAATHTDGVVLGQAVVPTGTTEIGSVATVLDQIDPDGVALTGTVVTVDALHTVRDTATTITDHGADYVMTVKANTAHLQAAIHEQFTSTGDAADATAEKPPQEDTTATAGHGRTEQRTLRVLTLPEPGQVGDVAFPCAAQVFRVVRYRGDAHGQRTSKEVVYGITSLTRDTAGAAELNALVRGHWSIENKVHHVRDVTFDEDHQRARTGNAPAVLATLRNMVIAAIRRAGGTNIAAARRAASSNPHTAITWFSPPTNQDTNPL